MYSVHRPGQEPAETRADAVKTTATRSCNLSADSPPSQDLQQVSKAQPSLAPYSQIWTGKRSLLWPTEFDPEVARPHSSFVICSPPVTNLQLSVTENGSRNENDVNQMLAEDESYITLIQRLVSLIIRRSTPLIGCIVMDNAVGCYAYGSMFCWL